MTSVFLGEVYDFRLGSGRGGDLEGGDLGLVWAGVTSGVRAGVTSGLVRGDLGIGQGKSLALLLAPAVPPLLSRSLGLRTRTG